MSADALPRQWTADDLAGLSEREQQIFYWGLSVGYQECAEADGTSAVFAAGYLAASQREFVDLAPKPTKQRRSRHLTVVPS